MKIDRTAIKIYYEQGLTDQEIASKLNCKGNSIRVIRTRELRLLRKRVYKPRKLYWIKYADGKIYGSNVGIPLICYSQLGINPGENIKYNLSPEKPNKIVIELRRVNGMHRMRAGVD